MSDHWDGDAVMSTPDGPIVTVSLGKVLARKDAEIERLCAVIDKLEHECANLNNENHRLRAVLQEVTLAAHGCAQCRDEIGHICRNALEVNQ